MTIMATAPVPAQHRLDSADTDVLPADDRVACPEWCVGGCSDVDPDDDDGTRLHDGKITALRGTGDTVVNDIYVRLSQIDTLGEAGRPAVLLEAGTAELTPDEAVQLAKVLVDHANRIRAAGVGEVLMFRAEAA